jgi:branched-chain amino acid transport system ATP-binding protein
MALLEIKDLNAYYGNVEALKGITMEVREGEIVALIGANGAGKSTTLRAISGLLRTEGSIQFAGREIGQPTERDLPSTWRDILQRAEGLLGRLMPLEDDGQTVVGIGRRVFCESVLTFLVLLLTFALLGGLVSLIVLPLRPIWPAFRQTVAGWGKALPTTVAVFFWTSLGLGLLGGFTGAVRRTLEGLRVRQRTPPFAIVHGGICHVPEGRRVFSTLTVQENLNMGAYTLGNDHEAIEQNRARVYALFPRLAERKHQLAGTLSGGEQQMLAIGRALMTKPRLLMLDEPSLGLAPMLVRAIFQRIREISEQGMTILLVEQNARAALRLANYAYVLETGEIALSGPAQDLLRDERVRKAYLGER